MHRLAVSRPITTFVFFIVVVVLGVLSVMNLPVDLLPRITLPSASVIVVYPGASPEDVENSVTTIIEDAISTVPNVENIVSYSSEGVSAVTVSFSWGTDMNAAVNDMKDRLDQILRLLPDDVEKPLIFKFDVSQWPVLVVALSSDDPTVDVRKILEKEVSEDIRRRKGVGAVQVWGGGKKRQINIFLDRDELELRGIPFHVILRRIIQENLSFPIGNIQIGRTDYSIRISQEFKSVEDIKNLPILSLDGALIRLGDIAQVEDGYSDLKTIVKVNKKEGVLFGILKTSDANTVEVAENAKRVLKEFEEKYKNIKVTIVNDSSKFIKESINNLLMTIFLALALVFFVSVLLLGSVRSGLIIALVIPVSLITAFIFLYITGSSINILSLASLAIAIGMVVDNAIVVYENIFYHVRKGIKRKEASIFGTQEVGLAILASTLTSVVIFIPILTVKGFVGVMFRELSMSVMLVLTSSLLIAFTLTPAISSKFLKIPSEKSPLYMIQDTFYRVMEGFYKMVLSISVRKKLLVVLLALLWALLGLIMFVLSPKEFMPTLDTRMIRGTILLPVGTRVEVTDSVMQRIESIIEKSVPEVKDYARRAGPTESGFGAAMGFEESSNLGFFSLSLKPKGRATDEVAKVLSDSLRGIPGLISYNVSTAGASEFLFGMESPISIEIYGRNLYLMDSLANEIRELISEIPGIKGARVSRQRGKPEIRINLDREKLNTLGLTTYDVAMLLRMGITGVNVSKLRKGDEEEVDIYLSLSRGAKDLALLRELSIMNLGGVPVSLSNFSDMEFSYGPLSIERRNKQRVIRVEAQYFGRPLGEVIKDVNKVLKEKVLLPPGLELKIRGAFERQQESFRELGFAIAFATLLVYLVMAGLFESFLKPLIIMLSVPFSLTGSALLLYFTNTPMSIMAFVGLLLLVGVVVNNAIVLLNYIETLRNRGKSVVEAVIEGSVRRLRPILMTVMTTVFGFLPIAIMRQTGLEWWRPFSISVIGGLIFSTLITLVLIPVVYLLIYGRVKS